MDARRPVQFSFLKPGNCNSEVTFKGGYMAEGFDGPGSTTGFNAVPSFEAEPVAVVAILSRKPTALTKTAEFIGGAAGKIVAAGKFAFNKMNRTDVVRGACDAAEGLEHSGSRIAEKTAQYSRNVSTYFKTHDGPDIANDLRQAARRHPAGALACAAALGFLFERALGRKGA